MIEVVRIGLAARGIVHTGLVELEVGLRRVDCHRDDCLLHDSLRQGSLVTVSHICIRGEAGLHAIVLGTAFAERLATS